VFPRQNHSPPKAAIIRRTRTKRSCWPTSAPRWSRSDC
jgi:hypothetical protein